MYSNVKKGGFFIFSILPPKNWVLIKSNCLYMENPSLSARFFAPFTGRTEDKRSEKRVDIPIGKVKEAAFQKRLNLLFNRFFCSNSSVSPYIFRRGYFREYHPATFMMFEGVTEDLR